MPRVRYIGSAPKKRANVLQALEKSTVVWIGHGDIQPVSDFEAMHLLNPLYNKIWELVDDSGATRELPISGAGAAALAVATPAAAPAPAVPAPAPAPAVALTDDEVKERLIAIVTVIPKLKRTDFESTGKPKLTALTDLVGWPVTAIERDAAWDSVKAYSGVKDDAAATTQAAPAAAAEELLVVRSESREAAPAEVPE